MAEILRLGAQKKDAYVRLDELERQLFAGNVLIVLLRGLLPGAARKAKREEFDVAVREIEVLRRRMDELWKLVPGERLRDIHHLWSFGKHHKLIPIERDYKKK